MMALDWYRMDNGTCPVVVQHIFPVLCLFVCIFPVALGEHRDHK